MISRIFYALFLGAIGAIIIHLAIIFLLPGLSANNPWSLIVENADIGEPILIDNQLSADNQNLFLDPLFETAACRFDLAEGTMHITAQGDALIWTIAVFDTAGAVLFSANDRIANSADVDLAIVNAAQLRFARENTPDELAQSVIAAAELNEGFALLRVYAPDPSWKSNAQRFLETMQCDILAF